MSKDDNRKRFPKTAALVDEFRAAGVDVTVKYCKEGNEEAGTPDKLIYMGDIVRGVDGVNQKIASIVTADKEQGRE